MDGVRRSRAWVLAPAVALGGACGCTPDPSLVDVEAVEMQLAVEPREDGWRAAPRGVVIEGDPTRPLWFRVHPPKIDAVDPALRVLTGYAADEIRQGARSYAVHGGGVIVPLDGSGAPLLVHVERGLAVTGPRVRAGSERRLWIESMRRELPIAGIGGAMLVTGLVLSLSALRRGGARAYRGLGLFLASLGTIVVLNLRQSATLLPVSGATILAAHNLATALYPLGFVDFVLAVFGDGPWRLLRRGRLAYLGFLSVAAALHLTHVRSFMSTRELVAPFIIAFAVQGIVLATRRVRAGDASARSFLVGIGVLLAFGLYDLAPTPRDVQLVPFGLLGFAISMVLMLERQFTAARLAAQSTASELEKQVDALEARNLDVQALNRELRHQIAERSRHLVQSLQGAEHHDGDVVARALSEGDEIGGRYRVVRALGQGGMGAVYEVERQSDRRRFALKVMAGRRSGAAAARFAREAEIAARVVDDNLVPVIDLGGVETGELFLVMELVRGQTLDEARARFGDVPWALGILPQIARGLRTLHAAGVVHRDLKPGNVLLEARADGSFHARIADFGISHLEADPLLERVTGAPQAPRAPAVRGPAEPGAAASDAPAGERERAAREAPTARESTTAQAETLPASPPPTDPAVGLEALPTVRAEEPVRSSAQLTATGMIMGTPAYMAPEAATGARALRPAADMFAFGLIAFEMLSGHPAFGVAPGQLALAGLRLPAPRPPPASVPAPLAALVLACLREWPEERPSADEAVEVLGRSARAIGPPPRART
jgi:serine/threonine protein kinase